MKKILMVLMALTLLIVVSGYLCPVMAQDDDAAVDTDTGADDTSAEPAAEQVFVCPDCGYESDEAGECPACNVALKLKSADAKPADDDTGDKPADDGGDTGGDDATGDTDSGGDSDNE